MAKRQIEDKYISLVFIISIKLAIFVMASAALISSIAALITLLILIFDLVGFAVARDFLDLVLGLEEKPAVLELLDIVEFALLTVMLLIFAFGLNSIFMQRHYKVTAFKIVDIDQLKRYLTGTIVTLFGTAFLERVFAREPELLLSGVGLGVFILALVAYIYVLIRYAEPEEEKQEESSE
ncbi:hypothetical protein LCGC14_0833880 [marine sediment metagenome]|uniref:YqhA family protein n=1 Tax=marine sediment metagenome TaxID=412755 RepID=A0A0F9RZW9_9ZZZZ